MISISFQSHITCMDAITVRASNEVLLLLMTLNVERDCKLLHGRVCYCPGTDLYNYSRSLNGGYFPQDFSRKLSVRRNFIPFSNIRFSLTAFVLKTLLK